MMLRWIGAGMILAACAGFGFIMAANYRREENALKQLLIALNFMECELQYRLSSLPELCLTAAERTDGAVSKVLFRFAKDLETQRFADAAVCMDKVLSEVPSFPKRAEELLCLLGNSVGRFDLEGQLKGLQQVRQQCSDMLELVQSDRDIRIRNYQTLGLCTGAALAILLI